MTIPTKYSNYYFPVCYFLSSYRALSDGRSAIALLVSDLEREELLLSDWKIHWIAACTLLRTSIDLFRHDAKLCVSKDLAASVSEEWALIAKNRSEHDIYWKFLREERNNIIHEYRWSAYEQYLDADGNQVQPAPSLLALWGEKYIRDLKIRSGQYEGRKAIELIQESSVWVTERIFSAISRANLVPTEERNAVTFQPRPINLPSLNTLLSE